MIAPQLRDLAVELRNVASLAASLDAQPHGWQCDPAKIDALRDAVAAMRREVEVSL